MKGLRDQMRDPRAAAAIGALAVLLVGYRVYQQASGPGSASPTAEGPDLAAKTETGTGLAGASAPPLQTGAGSLGSSSPGATREKSWSWDRNPFLPAEGKDLPMKLIPNAFPGSFLGEGAAGSERPNPSMALRGTVISEGKGVAIFGDAVVPEGGMVKGWTVERVEPYRVVVRNGTESRTLEMSRAASPGH